MLEDVSKEVRPDRRRPRLRRSSADADWCDRVLPGEGIADLPALLGALEAAGWHGFYDLEIFSDDGTFGTALPDSLWNVPAAELAAQGANGTGRRVGATSAARRVVSIIAIQGGRMKKVRLPQLVAMAALAAVLTLTGATSAASGKPIVIGAAIDLTKNMAPFDAPALEAAQIEIAKINAAGGVDGRRSSSST